MAHFRYLSFLTDYGLEDGFVAACHGVGARIAPHADIIDVTHLVPPGDIRRGATVLAQTVPYLPPAVHVAVVDPGVGTARRGIAVAAGDSVFIGPDNGLLSWALAAVGGADRAFSLTNRELWLSRVTPTFHGRDIFMPVAAHLAADAELAAAGDADRRRRPGHAARPGADGPRFHRGGRGAHRGPLRQRPALPHRGGRGGDRRQAGRDGACGSATAS